MPTRPQRTRGWVGLSATSVTGVLTLAAVAGCGSSSSGGTNATSGTGTASTSDTRTVDVVITSDGCAPALASYTSGPLTFKVSNKDATGVSEIELLSGERILGEKENLAPGFSGSFALALNAGDYTLYCPGAATEKTSLKVTGGTVTQAPTTTSALLAQGTKDYAQYVNTQVALMIENTQPLIDAIRRNDLTAAQAAYGKARPYYERIEPVAESFTSGKDNLDSDIDARADDVPAAEWTGYHRIEKGLFQDKSTAGLQTYATGLLTNLKKLQSLTKDLTYQPAELANGAVGLLDEASKTKITGEEERYSHIDVLDLQANVEGSEQAFAALKPGLTKIDPTLTDTIATRFAAVDTLLDKYRSAAAIGGFELFTSLSKADTTAIAQAIQAVGEPLSQVAGKVVNS
ncbi:MAG TPA: iron uptake system protein EfeO [Frankiaceae bacterium]|nr:iron uptake system protein EfeO [Frankiaceae bacterium]